MTLEQCIDYVDSIEPNAFSNNVKAQWVSECEGLVHTDVFLRHPRGFRPYTDYETQKDVELAVMPPHDKIYPAYLQAKIQFANGEYDRYANGMTVFNDFWGEFVRWFARVYEPAQGYGYKGG